MRRPSLQRPRQLPTSWKLSAQPCSPSTGEPPLTLPHPATTNTVCLLCLGVSWVSAKIFGETACILRVLLYQARVREPCLADCVRMTQSCMGFPSHFRHSPCRHEFVVVETIDFYQDEDAELPPPMTQRDVIILNKAGLEDEEPAAEENGDAPKDGKVLHLPMLRTWPLSRITCLPYRLHGVLFANGSLRAIYIHIAMVNNRRQYLLGLALDLHCIACILLSSYWA